MAMRAEKLPKLSAEDECFRHQCCAVARAEACIRKVGLGRLVSSRRYFQ